MKRMLMALAIAGVLSAGWSPAWAGSGSEIEVYNGCPSPIRIALRYADYRDDNYPYKTTHWYYFDPEEEAYLADSKGRLSIEDSHRYYFYAETSIPGVNIIWDGRDDENSVRRRLPDGRVVSFRSHDDSWGYAYDIDLYCDNLDEPPKVSLGLIKLATAIKDRGFRSADIAWLKDRVETQDGVHVVNFIDGPSWPQWAKEATIQHYTAHSRSCQDGMDSSQCLVAQEEWLDDLADGGYVAAGLTCTGIAAFFMGPFAVIPGIICGSIAKSVMKSVYNCTRNDEYNNLLKEVTGYSRENAGCVEISFVFPL